MWHRRAAPFAALAVAAWLASQGRGLAAEPTEVEGAEPAAVADALSLEPGATCLEHDRLTEQVVTWLERDEIDPRLTVVVEGDPIEVRTLRFTLQDRGHTIAERRFTPGPSSCDDLHAVVALAIALAVDATVLESVGIGPAAPTVPEPSLVIASEPEPEARPAKVLEPTPTLDLSPREPPWALRLVGRGLLTVGVPPTLGGGAQLGIEGGWHELVDLHLGVFASSAGPQPVDQATLAITLLAARADVCVGPQVGRVHPRICGGALAGSAFGRGRGFRESYRATLPWMAVALSGDVRVGLTRRTALSFGVDGLVTVVRPVFDVREEFQVRQLRDLPRFGAMLGMGFVVSLR